MRFVGWITFLLLLAATASGQAPVVFKDADFSTADWQLVTVIAGAGTQDPITVQQYQVGGNPGNFRLIEFSVDPGTSTTPSWVATFHKKTGAVYDPSQGPIGSIDYSEDVKVVNSVPGGAGQYMGPALQQADASGAVHIYVLPAQRTGAPAAWTRKSFTGLAATDFVELTTRVTRGVWDYSRHPDFTRAGKPIQFGFWRAMDNSGGGGGCGFFSPGPIKTSEGIDNWSVTLTVGTQAAACSIDPRNSFLPLHLPLFHDLFPDRNPYHKLNVTVLAGGSPAPNTDVKITATKAALWSGGTAVPTATARTNASGVAQFTLNPPPPGGFDRVDLTVSGTAGTSAFSCNGSVTSGLGAISDLLEGSVGRALQASNVILERYRSQLGIPPGVNSEDIASIPMSDRGRVMLARALKKHEAAISEAAQGRTVALTRKERKDLEQLARQLETEPSWHVKQGAMLLRRSLKQSTTARAAAPSPAPERTPSLRKASAAETAVIRESLDKLPMTFEPNAGQISGPARFIGRGRGYQIYLTDRELVLSDDLVPRWAAGSASQVRMSFLNANPAPQSTGMDLQAGRSNYMVGNNPAAWTRNVPHYGKVRYRDVYPGIDLVFYGHGRELQFDFLLAPGTRPQEIELAFSGADKLEIDRQGNLVLHQPSGQMTLAAPYVYQEIDGVRKPASSRYVLRKGNRVSFEVARYDAAQSLVIDPVLSYSSYLGGTRDESAGGIAIDAQGNAYVTGGTLSPSFPTVNPLQPWPAAAPTFAAHSFVTKLNATGTALVYSTFIGGSGIDGGLAIAVGPDGSAYVTGTTTSADFPLVNPIQGTLAGGGYVGSDGFVLKLDPTGGSLVYSTFLGGTDSETPKAIAVDGQGNAYVVGTTSSKDFPIRNAYQPVKAGGQPPYDSDAFVTKINASGSDFVYSTYLGGKLNDSAFAVAVDSAGNAYVAGATESFDFPLQNAIQQKVGGGQDAFITKFNPAGTALIWSTYLGGDADDTALGVALDGSNNVYVTGMASSTNFPTKNPIQAKLGSKEQLGGDAFVAKIAATGASLVYSTYLGGSGTDMASGIAVGPDGSAYVTGQTDSSDFPTLGNPLQPAAAGLNDAFVAKVSPDGSALNWATYLGGSGQDFAAGIALDSKGAVYVSGLSNSSDFPVTPGSFQVANKGFADLMIAKIVEGTPVPRATVVSTASLKAGSAPESLASILGSGLSTRPEQAGSGALPTTLGDRSVLFRDSSGAEVRAGMISVTAKQINFQVPAGVPPGLAGVTVVNGTQPVAAGTTIVDSVAPGLFSADGSGAGLALGTVIFTAADGSTTSNPIATCDSSGRCTATPIDIGSAAQVSLTLLGTGLRGRSSLNNVAATAGGSSVPVNAVDPAPDGSGMDNLSLGPLPAELTAKGTVPVVLTVDGKTANSVNILLGKTPPSAPVIGLSPSALDFGQVAIGQSKDLKFTIGNTGNAPLNVASITGNDASFSLVNASTPISVAPGKSIDITVRFAPRATGAVSDSLSIASDDPSRPRANLSLSGTGQPATSTTINISVQPPSLDFGNLLVGGNKDFTLTVTGTGNAPLVIQSFAMSSARFTLINPPALPITLGIAPTSLTVRYTPTAAGSDSGTLTISSNATNLPQYRVPLMGSAVAPGPLELKVDAGTFGIPVGFRDGAPFAHFLNRLTPPGYPATLNTVRIYFNGGVGQADLGTIINILWGANASGASKIDGLFLNGKGALISTVGQWVDFPVGPLTINSGDFVVGFSMPNPPGIFPVSADTNSVSALRSYLSPDGVKFTVQPIANLAIRAQITVGR